MCLTLQVNSKHILLKCPFLDRCWLHTDFMVILDLQTICSMNYSEFWLKKKFVYLCCIIMWFRCFLFLTQACLGDISQWCHQETTGDMSVVDITLAVKGFVQGSSCSLTSWSYSNKDHIFLWLKSGKRCIIHIFNLLMSPGGNQSFWHDTNQTPGIVFNGSLNHPQRQACTFLQQLL